GPIRPRCARYIFLDRGSGMTQTERPAPGGRRPFYLVTRWHLAFSLASRPGISFATRRPGKIGLARQRRRGRARAVRKLIDRAPARARGPRRTWPRRRAPRPNPTRARQRWRRPPPPMPAG